MSTALLWLRNDLRLHDHPALQAALAAHTQVLPVFVLDNRMLEGRSAFGFARIGSHRRRFLAESLLALRNQFQQLGADILLLHGHPSGCILQTALEYSVSAVYWHTEQAPEEQADEHQLNKVLAANGVATHTYLGNMLIAPEDLRFEATQMPDVYTAFRKLVAQQILIRSPLAAPDAIPSPEIPDNTVWSQLHNLLGVGKGKGRFTGGAQAGHGRLRYYFYETDLPRSYKDSRDGLLGSDYSMQLSPWLAMGCLSARQVYVALCDYEAAQVRNESTAWLLQELLWRDFFKLQMQKHGNACFRPGGIQALPIAWQWDTDTLPMLLKAQTGFPIIDAAVAELHATGFVGNRARQLLASFITKNMGLDWRIGAEWMEQELVDYDACSHYGNWNYLAGIGADARGYRYFDIIKQAQTHDPQGAYVKHWLPALQGIPAGRVHQPWLLSAAEQVKYSCRVGTDYPKPMLDLAASQALSAARYAEALNDPRLRKGNYRLRQVMKKR